METVMDNLRFVLFILMVFFSYTLWEQWQIDYGPKHETAPARSVNLDAATEQDAPVSTASDSSASPDKPAVPTASPIRSGSGKSRKIQVVTDVIQATLDTRGGDIRALNLIKYPVQKDRPEESVRLLTEEGEIFVSQNGFLGDADSAPSHHTVWQSSAPDHVQISPGNETTRVAMTWDNGNGVKITKTYIFTQGSYVIRLEHTVANSSAETWQGRQYTQLMRKEPAKEESTFIRSYTGAVIHTDEKSYEKISFKDMAGENLDVKSKHGWSAMIQHYFLAAWIPNANEENSYYTKALQDKTFVIGNYGPSMEVAPGEQTMVASELYAGPKLNRVLEATAPGLELTEDFGGLTFIAKPIFWLLEKFHKNLENWGLAIIMVTLVIKLMFFKLSEASYKSMANMRKLQPKLQELKEKCGDDRQRFNQSMMEMYRKEKVNPLGGCLPILVQIPVFISLYWVLAESVELRQAPFFFWLNDLSSKDPFFILPLIMGITMFIQQRLNPPPTDPLQAKVMQFFPFVFTIFFAFFPSGLVLYWVVNNSLSILQQWYITRQIEKMSAQSA
jgi:YidC/Oxa1 family membrane protein insertase